jgi:sugar-phosphatase
MLALDCQSILFDMDGTLIESTFYIERLWQDWGIKHGVSPQYMSEVMHGRRGVEIISIVAPHLSIQEEAYALETDEILKMEGMKAYPNAKELLSTLPRKQWAIVTSGSLRVASARLNHAKLPSPDVFITADDVTAGKPAPDAYLLAASRLNVKPSDCVVVEDTAAGIQAAKAAGMKAIGIAATRPREMLKQADVIVKQLADIKLSINGSKINIQFK